MNTFIFASTFFLTVTAALSGCFLWRRACAAPPLRLATGWNVIHKRWSTWLTMAGGVLLAAPNMIAHALNVAWAWLPPELRTAMPPSVVQGIGWALLALKFLAMLVEQRGLVAQAKPAGPIHRRVKRRFSRK